MNVEGRITEYNRNTKGQGHIHNTPEHRRFSPLTTRYIPHVHRQRENRVSNLSSIPSKVQLKNPPRSHPGFHDCDCGTPTITRDSPTWSTTHDATTGSVAHVDTVTWSAATTINAYMYNKTYSIWTLNRGETVGSRSYRT